MNNISSLILILLSFITIKQHICTIEGKVINAKNKEPLLFASVVIYKSGILVNGSEADMEGNFFLSDIKPGIYDIEASYVGYTSQKLTGVIIKDGSNRVNFELSDESVLLDHIEIKAYKVPLLEFDCTTTGATTSDKIRNLPTKSIHDIAATSTGISSDDRVSIRGSRATETVYFLDGVRVSSLSKGTEKAANSGVVTTGERNDLNNWEKWSELLKQDDFKNMNSYWGIYTQHRYPVFISNENHIPISGVTVYLKNSKDSIIWSAISDMHGHAELFDMAEQPSKNLILHYQYGNTKNKISLLEKNRKQGTDIIINAKCRSIEKANIAFVADATGSMGDEIAFLKSDLASVIANVESRNSDVTISYGSVFYQDRADSYVTKAQEFTTDENKLISFIEKQNAGGGGDFPEAVDSALIHTLDLAWEDDAAVKLIFLILDAPPHFELIERYKNAVVKAAKMGVKIIPVTASGINRETDFLMKFTSILTNGTYAFITNHSGVGGEHLAPIHDDYEVEKLNDLLLRVINGYLYSTPCDNNSLAENIDPISIQPNPAKDMIHVKSLSKNLKTVEIISTTGQILLSTNVKRNEKVSINIQNLISGRYFVRLTYDGIVTSKSFLKID